MSRPIAKSGCPPGFVRSPGFAIPALTLCKARVARDFKSHEAMKKINKSCEALFFFFPPTGYQK